MREVKAKKPGFIYGIYRKRFDEFYVEDGDFSHNWMVDIDEEIEEPKITHARLKNQVPVNAVNASEVEMPSLDNAFKQKRKKQNTSKSAKKSD